MSIYIQVENIQTGESKRFGPYEVVAPDLSVDEGNGWTEGPVSAILDSVDIYDGDGEPYSYMEGDPHGKQTYWHNCYIVSGEPSLAGRDPWVDSVFGGYTDDPTMLRIYREHDGDWTLDGINRQGQYTEATWTYDDLEDLLVNLPAFIDQHAPSLKDVKTYATKYMPIVTATHDEVGNVIKVEIDWADSQNAIEQLQDGQAILDSDMAEALGARFDTWVLDQPLATERGVWRWGEDV